MHLKKARILIWVLPAALLVGGVPGLADRGAIVTVGTVDVEEPAQRAIIAHNGARELLILQTDVQADRETSSGSKRSLASRSPSTASRSSPTRRN